LTPPLLFIAEGTSLVDTNEPIYNIEPMNEMQLGNLLTEAEGYYELELYDEALKRLDEFDAAGGDRNQSLRMRGECLRAADRFEDALTVLEESNRLDPRNMLTYISLGWCYKRTDRLPLAVRALERAVDVDPDFALAKYNLACYYSLAGEDRKCFDFLATAIEQNPEYAAMARTESDFDNVRDADEFRALTAPKR
jgi:tetratricopeptide (TPR) repeat protein